jgi:hypothetical protein
VKGARLAAQIICIMKLVEFVPPVPHPLWTLCRQMGIDEVVVKVNPSLTGLPDPWRRETLAKIVGGLGTSGWAFQDGATAKFANVAALRQGLVRKFELVKNDQKAISISDATLAAWRAALPDGCSLKLSSDKKTLSFALKDGLMLIIR